MKIHKTRSFLYSGLLVTFFLPCCHKSNGDPGNGSTDGAGSKKIFSLPLTGLQKINGLAYDSLRNGLYILEQLDTMNCAVIEFDLNRQAWYPVYSALSGGTDGGLRVFSDSIYLVRTGEKRIDVLKIDTNVFQLGLADSIKYPQQAGEDALEDLAIFGKLAYFVMKPYVQTDRANQIPISSWPFTDWNYLANAAATNDWGWNGNDPIARSLVANLTYLIVAPGGTNKIEARDRSTGEWKLSVEGPGNSTLQQDSRSRVYAIDAVAGKVIRWNFDLTGRQDFPIPNWPKTAPAGGRIPFALRESGDKISLFYSIVQQGAADLYQLSLPQ